MGRISDELGRIVILEVTVLHSAGALHDLFATSNVERTKKRGLVTSSPRFYAAYLRG